MAKETAVRGRDTPGKTRPTEESGSGVIIQGDPGKNAYVITNNHVITDENGKVIEVKGLGVVGQQPLLKPGESFEYTSGTHLETAVGTMRGTYQMVAEDGKQFDASIPSFTLSVPRILH